MPFEGNLADISIVDVIQLLHLTKKSGTLSLKCGASKACLSFRNGEITSASHPDPQVDIGKILIENGAVTQSGLQAAVSEQKSKGENRLPLIATMARLGLVEPEDAWKGLKCLIEKTVYELVGWKRGSFIFDTEQVFAGDEFSYFPSGVMPDMNLDTQIVLMDALRIFDEKNRTEPEIPDTKTLVPQSPVAVAKVELPAPETEKTATANPSPITPVVPPPIEPVPELKKDRQTDAGGAVVLSLKEKRTEKVDQDSPVVSAVEFRPSAAEIMDGFEDEQTDDLLTRLDCEEDPDREPRSKRVILFLTNDGFLKYSVNSIFKETGIKVEIIVGMEQEIFPRIKRHVATGVSLVIAADISEQGKKGSGQHRKIRLLEKVKCDYPDVPLIVVLDEEGAKDTARIYEIGARAVVVKPLSEDGGSTNMPAMKQFFNVLEKCLRSIFRERKALTERTRTIQNQMAILKRRAQELQSNEMSQEISLLVLQYMADNLERAVIFLVRQEDIIGLGAFGIENYEDSNPTQVMKIRIPLEHNSIFRRVVKTAEAYHGESDDPLFKEYLFRHIATPICSEVILLPLRTGDKTILLVYGDFGGRPPSPVVVDALEILASQAGMAFENALLRRKIAALLENSNKKAMVHKK